MIDVDLVEIARGAVFEALEAGLAGTGATALDHVEQDAPTPFVQIGEIEWANEGGKHELVLRISFDIETVYVGADRAELLAIMHAAFVALHGADLAADVAVFAEAPTFQGGGASRAASDGKTYAGLQSFELVIEPA